MDWEIEDVQRCLVDWRDKLETDDELIKNYVTNVLSCVNELNDRVLQLQARIRHLEKQAILKEAEIREPKDFKLQMGYVQNG